MPRPQVDPEKLRAALEAVRAGASQAAAAARAGIGLATLKRAMGDGRASAPVKASPPPLPASPLAPPPGPGPVVARPAPPTSPVTSAAAPPTVPAASYTSQLLLEVESALEGAATDPEARVIGLTLRELVASIPQTDPGKLPQVANSIKTLTAALRDMRPARPPSRDEVDERLRELDRPTLEMIEEYTAAADKLLTSRASALKAWAVERLSQDDAAEHSALVDGLFAPPSPAPPVATGTA
jgi:hypothetical protein